MSSASACPEAKVWLFYISVGFFSILSLDGLGLGAFSEAVLDSSWQVSEVSHSASASGGSSNGFFRPVVSSEFSRGVSSGSASLLLLVPVLSSRESANSV